MTGRVAVRLREAKFLVSPKSTLEPTARFIALQSCSMWAGESSLTRGSPWRSWFLPV